MAMEHERRRFLPGGCLLTGCKPPRPYSAPIGLYRPDVQLSIDFIKKRHNS